MARDVHDLFRAFGTAHNVVLKQNTPLVLRIPGLVLPVTVVVQRNDMFLTVADADEDQPTPDDDRTFVAMVTTSLRSERVLSGVSRFGQLMRLEQAVPTWHDLHTVLLAHADPRWQAFGWAAEVFRLVGDCVAVAKIRRARKARQKVAVAA
jgi:hypothetical protein